MDQSKHEAQASSYLEIDGKRYEFLPDAFFKITEFGFFSAGIKTIAAASTLPLGPEDIGGEEIHLRVSIKGGQYNGGVPKGEFKVGQDHNETFIRFEKRLYDLRSELTGILSLDAGWFHFVGQLLVRKEELPFEIHFQFDIKGLDWSGFHFGSIKDAKTTELQNVKYMSLHSPNLEEFNAEIHRFTALKELIVLYDEDGQDVRMITPAIRQLSALKKLQLVGMSGLKHIPAQIGDLHKLEMLIITESQITSIPEEIFKLPKLRYLNLSENKLAALPPLLPPKLETLLAHDNQLASIPKALAQKGEFKQIGLERNPLVALPSGIEVIDDIELEMRKKRLLLDYSYRGADGLGTVAYDDKQYYVKYDLRLRVALVEETKAVDGLERYVKGLLALAFKAVALDTTTLDDYSRLGNTRLGGLPDLPKGIKYPTFENYRGDVGGMQFMAQLNCAELAPYQSYLPRNGILYFFVEDQISFRCKVVYHPVSSESLVSAKELDIDDSFIYDGEGVLDPYAVSVGPYASLPTFDHDYHLYKGEAAVLEALEREVYRDRIYDLSQKLSLNGVRPKHGINTYVYTEHESPQRAAADSKRGEPDEWMVLLHLSSDSKSLRFWGAGDIYFVIHKSDLAKGLFNNVHCGLELESD